MPTLMSPPRRGQRTESVPARKRWTRAECEMLERAGFLPQRYELIAGEIYDKMTVNPPHSITLMILAIWLEQVFGRPFVRTQDPIHLPHEESKPEPDVIVMREPVTIYHQQHPSPTDLLLVAEVSDSTLAFDLKEKAALYARAGIAEYWVADVVGRRFLVHRQPTSRGYQEITIYTENETLSPLARPESSVCVADLLPSI